MITPSLIIVSLSSVSTFSHGLQDKSFLEFKRYAFITYTFSSGFKSADTRTGT